MKEEIKDERFGKFLDFYFDHYKFIEYKDKPVGKIDAFFFENSPLDHMDALKLFTTKVAIAQYMKNKVAEKENDLDKLNEFLKELDLLFESLY